MRVDDEARAELAGDQIAGDAQPLGQGFRTFQILARPQGDDVDVFGRPFDQAEGE
jgi:hypothetical protein